MRAILSLFVVVVLSSCATTSNTSKPQLVLVKLRELGVSDTTCNRIAQNRVLTYEDIYGMVQKKVPAQVIVTYLKSTHAPYTLTDAQLQALVDLGAGSDLVNYLGKSTGFFEATERAQTGGAGKWRNDPFFADPFFWGPAPFDYAYPADWYDPGWVAGVF